MVLGNEDVEGVLCDSSTQMLNPLRVAEAAAALAQALLMCQHPQRNHLQNYSILHSFINSQVPSGNPYQNNI